MDFYENFFNSTWHNITNQLGPKHINNYLLCTYGNINKLFGQINTVK